MPKPKSKRRIAKEPKEPKEPNNNKKPYGQVGRVLDVLDVLKDGPLTTAELSAALNQTERSTYRFMGAMLRSGWPVLYHKTDTTSSKLKWGFDVEKLCTRFDQ